MGLHIQQPNVSSSPRNQLLFGFRNRWWIEWNSDEGLDLLSWIDATDSLGDWVSRFNIPLSLPLSLSLSASLSKTGDPKQLADSFLFFSLLDA